MPRKIFKKDYRGFENIPVKNPDLLTISYENEKEKQRILEELSKECMNKCVYCGWDCNLFGGAPFHIDHVKSQAEHEDLKNNYQNMVLACPICNTTKGKKEILLNPLDTKFPKLFYRNKVGAIVPNLLIQDIEQKTKVSDFIKSLGLDKELHKIDYVYLSLKMLQKRELEMEKRDLELIIKITEIIETINENYRRKTNIWK